MDYFPQLSFLFKVRKVINSLVLHHYIRYPTYTKLDGMAYGQLDYTQLNLSLIKLVLCIPLPSKLEFVIQD